MDLSRRRRGPQEHPGTGPVGGEQTAPLPRDLQQRIVVRPTSGRVTLGVVLGLAVLLLALTVWQRDWHSLPQLAAWVALLCYGVWWWFDASSLRIDAHGVTVDNPLRWAHLPWPVVRGAQAAWGLKVEADRSYPVWAVPARPGVGVARSHAAGRDGRGGTLMPTATADAGLLPTLFGPPGTVEVSLSASAAARLLDESRLLLDEQPAGVLAAAPTTVRRGVHWSRFGLALALAALVWLIPVVVPR